MKKLLYIYGVAAAVALPALAQAQTQPQDSTLNRTVVVEQEYNPNIMDASKVNVMPRVTPPTVSPKSVEYDSTLAPAQNIPPTTMQAYSATETQEKAKQGYARLGYGNYGNLDARANYLFLLPNSNKLNLELGVDGMNGKLHQPGTEEKWKARYYRTRAGVDYLHSFSKADLDVAADFGVSNFNLLPQSISGRQKFTAGSLHLGVKSTSQELPVQFHAQTNLMLYERLHDIMTNNTRETIIRTKAGATGSISDEQLVGVDLAMNNVFYNNDAFENYTSIELNPHYIYNNGDWDIRLGANVDLAFGFGKELRVSPDVKASYNFSDSYILYAQATGGRQENDFRQLEATSPHAMLPAQADATYEQLNAAIGLKASPAAGVWFNLYAGYQNLKNAIATLQTMHSTTPTDAHTTLSTLQGDVSNVYAAAQATCNYKDFITLSAEGIYRNWKAKNDSHQMMLAFMPAFEANIKAEVRPVASALVALGYQHISRTKVYDTRIDPISNLHLSASYELFSGISIYLRASNLLNKKYQHYQSYAAEGVNFVGGMSFVF